MRVVLLTLCMLMCGGAGAQEPSKCCLKPDMCSFVTGTLIGYGSGSNYGSFNQYTGVVADYTKSRFALNITTVINGNTSTSIIIENFVEKLQWVIDPVAETCTKMAIPDGTEKVNRCVPDIAKFEGQLTIAGDKLCNTWSFPLKTKSLDGVFTSTTTADQCIPVSGSFVGTSTQGGVITDVVEGIGYYNFEALDDVSKYFVLPPYCQQSLNEPHMKIKIPNEGKIMQARRFM